MELEINVDRDRCLGSGQCVWLAPGVFDQDEKAIAFVVDPRGEPGEKIAKAVTGCPVEAISLRIGAITIGARDLWHWQHGAAADDPVVSLLLQTSEEHETLRQAVAALRHSDRQGSPPPVSRPETATMLADSLISHLAFEDDHVYPALIALLDPALVNAFDADHSRIRRAATPLDPWLDPKGTDPVVHELAGIVEEHIRIEETVLFPLALAALHRAARS